MKKIHINKFLKREFTEKIIIFIAPIVLIYILISLYFVNHFFFNTIINGVDVSLKSYKDADDIIRNYIKDYELQIKEKSDETEEIKGQDIGLQYNEINNISKIYHMQNSFKWINSLFRNQKYYVNDLYVYNEDKLKNRINKLKCFHKVIMESQNVDFKYSNGSYEAVKEVYGNKVIRDKLYETVKTSILKGRTNLDLNKKHCYEIPKYTLSSEKTLKTMNLLNKYVSMHITYKFGDKKEILDGIIINKWLSVNKNLDVVISKAAVMKYVNELSRKYDTVGVARNFKTSTGKIVEVKGGLYGWKINKDAETKSLLVNLNHGGVIEKEPIYTQKALSRDENEIGNTYVEINITKQRLWFYKDGKLITQGSVVTGNPNRGYSTVIGTYMLNYKQKGATLAGPGYEVKVTYWMPFYGGIGIHDASWRYSFGGEIYKRNGTHGCVNAPIYLAKTIFEYIEIGIPIICYEE